MAIVWTGLSLILIGAALAGGVAVALRYRQDIRSAHARITRLGSQVIETSCGPIEYACFGDGYPVLVVHGAMGGFDQGLWLANTFRVPGCQYISVSRFGYLGSSLPPGANLDMQADAFASLLDALGIRQAAVFGISAGSTSALRFVARHPERASALILLGPDAPGDVQMPIPPRFVFDTLLRSDFVYWVLVTYFGKWVQTEIGLVPKSYVLTAEQTALMKQVQVGDLPVSRRIDGMIFETYTLLSEFRASVTPASPYPLSHIKTPALVINARDDPISLPENVRQIVEQLPNARLYAVPNGGHFLFGHVQEAQSEVAEFMRSAVAGLQNSGEAIRKVDP